MKSTILLLAGILTWFNVFAQPGNDSLDQYFDDDNLSRPKIILKTNIVSLPNGDLPFFSEFILSRPFTVNLGASIQLPFNYPEIWARIQGAVPDYNIRGGYGFRIDPRIYIFKGDGGEGTFVGPVFRFKNLKALEEDDPLEERKIRIRDFGILAGTQLALKRRFTFDYNTGIGWRFTKIEDMEGNLDEELFSLFLIFTFNLGFKI